jgi:hypothetical protein
MERANIHQRLKKICVDDFSFLLIYKTMLVYFAFIAFATRYTELIILQTIMKFSALHE